MKRLIVMIAVLILPVFAWADGCKIMEYAEMQDMTSKELKTSIARYHKSIADTDKDIELLNQDKTPENVYSVQLKLESQFCSIQQVAKFEQVLQRRNDKKKK
jgi:FPC/CPF motif-containing protein YcgG